VSIQQSDVIVRAASTVVTMGGTAPFSAADKRGISSAMVTVFGDTSERDLDSLKPISSGELVRVLGDEEVRLDLVRVLAVLALLDGMVEKPRSSWCSTLPRPSMSMLSSSTRCISCSWIMRAGSATT
jgi:hypothetical protein